MRAPHARTPSRTIRPAGRVAVPVSRPAAWNANQAAASPSRTAPPALTRMLTMSRSSSMAASRRAGRASGRPTSDGCTENASGVMK